MDQAALDHGGRPAFLDSAGGSLSSIDHSDHRGGDTLKQLLVVQAGFTPAPVPGQDIIQGGCHDKTPATGIGSIDKDLVIDRPGVLDHRVRYFNQPAPTKPSLQRGRAHPNLLCGVFQATTRGAVINELPEHRRVGDIRSGFGGGCSAEFAPPPRPTVCGGAIAFHIATAVASWSVLRHPATTSLASTTSTTPHRGMNAHTTDICTTAIHIRRNPLQHNRKHRPRTHNLTLNPLHRLTDGCRAAAAQPRPVASLQCRGVDFEGMLACI